MLTHPLSVCEYYQGPVTANGLADSIEATGTTLQPLGGGLHVPFRLKVVCAQSYNYTSGKRLGNKNRRLILLEKG